VYRSIFNDAKRNVTPKKIVLICWSKFADFHQIGHFAGEASARNAFAFWNGEQIYHGTGICSRDTAMHGVRSDGK
jgi:hypothetical protein